jgi:beta-glucanase (GH16 family)
MPFLSSRLGGGRTALPHRSRGRRGLTAVAALTALAAPVLVTGGTSTTAGAATASTPTGTTSVSGWKLDLNENFDSLNTSRWTVKNNAAHGNEESYITSNNVSLSSGILRIQAKKQSLGGRKYTSGYVDSRKKYTLPNTFRIEIRAKVPLEEGMWAAPMWLRPADNSGGEIDLLETYGHDMQKFGEYRYHHTIHDAYGSNHHTNQKQGRLPGDPLGWHTYVIEKKRGEIAMYVDGKLTGTWRQGDPTWFNTYYEAGKRWSMIMNLQIGGHRGSPDSRTDWSADKTALQIDYVRTWVQG